MKKIILLFMLVVAVQFGFSQGLSGVNYQAVARNLNGTTLTNSQVLVQFTITAGSGGAVQYQETHTTTTNAYGLMNLVIGKGTPTTGTFTTIPWVNANQWLEVKVGVLGGALTSLGKMAFQAVPFSMMAGAAKPAGPAGGDLAGSTYPDPVIAANAVTTNKIADNAATTTKIADANVTTAKLADGSVTAVKIAAGVIPTSLPPSGAAGGDLAGSTYPNPVVAANAITTIKIANGSVTAAKLAPGVIPTTLPPSGAAAGDLGGTYPNPSVVKLQGRSVSVTAPTAGQSLVWNAINSTWEPGTAAGGTIGGSGTLNYIPKFTPSGTALGNSRIFDGATFTTLGSTANLDLVGEDAFGIQNTTGTRSSMALQNNFNNNMVTGRIEVRDGGYKGMQIATSSNHGIAFYTNSIAAMQIAANGNLGLKKNDYLTLPSARLEVAAFNEADNNYTTEAGFSETTGAAVTDKISSGMGSKTGIYAYADGGTIQNVAISGETGKSGNTNVGLFGRVSLAPVAGSTSTAILGFDVINATNTYALRTSGKLRMYNNGEAAGRVLTSDAVGNASWQDAGSQSVGISGGDLSTIVSIADNIWVPITKWAVLQEDGGANYNATTGEYTITKNGVYQINGQVIYNPYSAPGTLNLIRVNRNGLGNEVGNLVQGVAPASSIYGIPSPTLGIARRYAAGDKITVEVFQNSGAIQTLPTNKAATGFSIHFLHN